MIGEGAFGKVRDCDKDQTIITNDTLINHKYNKILKSDWFLTALISALIGQFNRTVHVMRK